MDSSLTGIFDALVKHGGAWGVLAAICFYLLIKERKRADKATDKLVDLSEAMIKATSELTHTLESVEKDVDDIKRTHT